MIIQCNNTLVEMYVFKFPDGKYWTFRTILFDSNFDILLYRWHTDLFPMNWYRYRIEIDPFFASCYCTYIVLSDGASDISIAWLLSSWGIYLTLEIYLISEMLLYIYLTKSNALSLLDVMCRASHCSFTFRECPFWGYNQWRKYSRVWSSISLFYLSVPCVAAMIMRIWWELRY